MPSFSGREKESERGGEGGKVKGPRTKCICLFWVIRLYYFYISQVGNMKHRMYRWVIKYQISKSHRSKKNSTQKKSSEICPTVSYVVPTVIYSSSKVYYGFQKLLFLFKFYIFNNYRKNIYNVPQFSETFVISFIFYQFM